MSKKVSINLLILVAILVVGGIVIATSAYYADLPDRLSQHETIILGQNRWVPGSQASLRVVVRDSRDATALAGAEVFVSMHPAAGGQQRDVYSGVTNAKGDAVITFPVPEDAESEQVLRIETRSRLGSDSIERNVTLERDYRVLLTTDKPLYQPGQTIHVRALALSTFGLTPAASQELEFTIADGKGNKVFRQKAETSQFGVASTDFQLASEVNTGAYKIMATLGSTTSEVTVNVEHYALPKFSIELETEKPYYLPGENVRGDLEAGYFYGKPVAGGQVVIEGFTFDVERNILFSLSGTTDEQGRYAYEFDLPSYLTGSDLDGGLGRFYLQATVTDLAQHSETTNLSLTVAQNSLVIEAVPEGGQFRPGVENILYVLTSYPDGTPATTALNITFYNEPGLGQSIESGPYGLAEVHLTPQNPYQGFLVEARDERGNLAQREFYYEGEWSEETVLLRPDKPVYRVGETMNLSILTSQQQGAVYLDMVSEGQTVSTRQVEVAGGHAEVPIDLTPDLYGTLELHAYKILRSGNIARDTRLVVVDNAQDLNLTIAAGQGTYRPGEIGGLDLQVNGVNGQGVQAAIGLAIVDESVFALAEQDPGFAKLYFMLEQELLVPRYDLHGFSIPDLVRGLPASTGFTKEAIEDAAQASLSAATSKSMPFSLEVNSHQDALQNAQELRIEYFSGLSQGLIYLLFALPLIVLVLSILSARREGRLLRSVLFPLILLGGLLLFILWRPLPEYFSSDSTFLVRLAYTIEGMLNDAGIWLLITMPLSLVGYLILLGYAWKRKDASLAWSLLLILVALVVLVGLLYAWLQGGVGTDEAALLWIIAAFAVFALAYLVRSSNDLFGKRYLPALAALLVAFFLLFGALPVLAMPSMSMGFASAPMPLMVEADQRAMQFAELQAMPAAMLPAPTETPPMEVSKENGANRDAAATREAPRLRQYFPETMLWLPEEITDQNGTLHLDVPVADSITTWRVTALASSQDGRLGSATAGLRVFQDFFIDLDLPLALTVGDEVSIPVGVFNYLPEEQLVRLELAPADWYELLDDPVKEVNIAANDISVVYFRLRAARFGKQSFQVTAIGSRLSDAIQKELQVFPDGKQITFTHSDRLVQGSTVRQPVSIPLDAVLGTQSLSVKIYPGLVSQVVEGLDEILRMPSGCFEQTSSTTYPNVLVLDYLKSTGQTSPEVQLKAEEYINLGYQRLVTFEVDSSGGFSLFGDAPADRMLTAYGLQEFSDMSRVSQVDPALIQRAAAWLLAQQSGNGSWENDIGLVHENTWSSLGDDRLPVTAYITWSLISAGFANDLGTQSGISFIRENQANAQDAYELALVANALVEYDLALNGKLDGSTQAVLDRLAGMAIQEGNAVYWQSSIATFMGSEGKTGSIETTALAALAFLRSNNHPELANAALTYLIQQKDSFGTWYSTQATVMTLKALIESVRAGAEQVDAVVTVSLNGGQTRTVQVTPENFDVVQLLSFSDILPTADNVVEITVEGEGNLMYQIAGGYYLPWDRLASYPELVEGQELVEIDIAYDRTELAVDDTVQVGVTVSLNEGNAESALIDLGVPPGFSLQAEDLAALVTRFDDVPADYALPTIERYEFTGRQIMVYVSNLSAGNPLSFSYRLRARYPLQAQTPASNAYDYYNPDVTGESAPQRLVVNP